MDTSSTGSLPSPLGATPGGEARRSIAEALLREAVERSRAAGALRDPFGDDARADAPGRCGLGERASLVAGWSESGRRGFESLWPSPPDAATEARVRAVLDAWVIEQDALDRQRNHFLKAFRTKHGFDRRAYSPERTAEFEGGLARVNAEEDVARRAAAERLLALVPRTSTG